MQIEKDQKLVFVLWQFWQCQQNYEQRHGYAYDQNSYDQP